MFKKILIIHLVVSVAYFAIALLAGTPHHFVSLIAGCSMMGINLALVIWTWSKIFRKKSIALASSVIVFKYAILGVFIYLIVVHNAINGMWFLIGSTSVVPTLIGYALLRPDEQDSISPS